MRPTVPRAATVLLLLATAAAVPGAGAARPYEPPRAGCATYRDPVGDADGIELGVPPADAAAHAAWYDPDLDVGNVTLRALPDALRVHIQVVDLATRAKGSLGHEFRVYLHDPTGPEATVWAGEYDPAALSGPRDAVADRDPGLGYPLWPSRATGLRDGDGMPVHGAAVSAVFDRADDLVVITVPNADLARAGFRPAPGRVLRIFLTAAMVETHSSGFVKDFVPSGGEFRWRYGDNRCFGPPRRR